MSDPTVTDTINRPRCDCGAETSWDHLTDRWHRKCDKCLDEAWKVEQREMFAVAERAASATPEHVEHILQFFEYGHLPENLQAVSWPFCSLAHTLVEHLPRNPERTVALRKLLEAKDAAVRALIAKP